MTTIFMDKRLPLFLDCTLRDGGYVNGWKFSRQFARALYKSASAAGCDYFEAGFLLESQEAGLPWTNLTAADLAELRGDVTDGSRIAVMINYGKVDLDDIPPASDYPADLIRVAAPKKAAAEAARYSAAIAAKGYATTINFMGVSNYRNDEILNLVEIINTHKEEIDFFYVADSFGSLLPSRTREIFTALRFGTDAPLGFHPHNNLQLAFANCLEAIEAGVNIIDGSVFGMGRGGGNLFTEAMLAYFERENPERYNLLPILQFADLYMEDMKERYSWGYSLPQLMTGMLSCHPNYPTNLLRGKSYTADVIHHMLHELTEEEKPRFSPDVLAELEARHHQRLADATPVAIDAGLQDLCRTKGGRALLLGGGPSVSSSESALHKLINEQNLAVFSINNPDAPLPIDGVFFGNRRRILKHHTDIPAGLPVVLTPDIHETAVGDFGLEKVSWVNPLKLAGDGSADGFTPTNSAIEAILGLVQMGFREVYLGGVDGYTAGRENYYGEKDGVADDRTMQEQNRIIEAELDTARRLGEKLDFRFSIITPTLFEKFHDPEVLPS